MVGSMNDELLTRQAVETFLDRWMNDPGFPEQLRKDPRKVFLSMNLVPSEELLESLMKSGASLPFEELKERISKGISMQ